MNILWNICFNTEYRFVLIFCSTVIELYIRASTLRPWEWFETFNHLAGDTYRITHIIFLSIGFFRKPLAGNPEQIRNV